MSVHADNVVNASEQSDAEEINVNNDRVSSKLLEERIRANLEPLKSQPSLS